MSTSFAIIVAGGRGTRFWPLSTPTHPKQTLPLCPDGRTLLRATVDRIRPLFQPDRILVITGEVMADEVRACLPTLPEQSFLVEPDGRNTAAALTWASAEVARRGGTCLVSLHADHLVDNEPAFRAAVSAALRATSSGDLILLGMTPTHPHTGFGYIVPGDQLDDSYRVERFIEKPAARLAASLITLGALWNAGLFAWQIDAFAREIDACVPGLSAGFTSLRSGAPVTDVWQTLPVVSVDRGVLERSSRARVIACDVGWSDVGSWDAADRWMPAHTLGRARVARGVALDGGNHVVYAPGKSVATLGVSNLVIVDTGDTLLVTTREHAQQVGRLAAAMAPAGIDS